MSAVEAHVQQLTVTELPSSLASILARFPNLRPAKKAPNEPRTPSKGYGVQSTQRQALAQGLVLLMQRASDLDTPDLTQLCRSALHQTFQREPWMWSLLLQRHADLVLAHAGAARLLAGVLSSLPDAMQARALESLAGHLQAAATATAAATGASARDGLEPFLALALNVLEAGFPGGLKGGGRGEAEEAQDPTQDTTQPPDFRPSPASAPALRLILVAGTATTSLGRRRAIRALAAQLSCAATVVRIVGAWGEGRAAQRARRIQALALLLAGDCAGRAFQPVTEEAGAVQGARTSLAALSTLLAVHWELAQYLAALGSRSSDVVDWPPPLRAQILRLLLDPDGVGGRQGPRIGLAPPLLAHALGLVAQGPLATGGDHAAHAEALRLVWLGHCACIQASPPSPGRSGASGEQPDSDSGSLPPARVLMRPTPDMGEEEREAMWAAYIADKESMLDLLGTSVAAPWQGAGAACLGLALCTLRACDGAGEVYAGDKVGAANGPLAWVQALLPPLEGSDAVALGVQAALGLLGFQSRNCWTAAMQGASSCPLGMVGLTLALHLHELVTRRARWAAPVWLEAVLKLLCWLMPLARQEAKQAALAERVARYAPLALLPDILREVLSSSRLGPSNLTPSSATALLDLEPTPGRAPELADKAVTVWASLAWLAFHAAGHADCTEDPLPDWVVEEALDHPVVGVRGDTLRAALDWLFRRLAAAAAGWTGIAIFATPADPQTADDAAATPATTALALLPVWDVAATCACEPAGRPIVPGAAPPASLVSGALDLMAACLACARRPLARLAAELDALTCAHAGRGSRDPRAATPPHAAHAAAEVLALSLELAGRVGGCVAVHEAAALEARRLLEEVMGLQAACAELLRTCPEACVAALASTADAAPRLFDPGEPGGADGADASPALARVTNPYLKAVLCEEGGECVGEGELSDLEDFIVANPERDYGSFIGAHFPRPHESESEEGSGEGAAPPQDHD
ncbi:hypothetical protein F751_4654 [Auxenochlorella protothecoides]|uniref:Uncharacterized protein n=1 Tax=Auxenochlorella protothecoides TaxID=3075 RepID=A0A087SKA7_AUXPR|nr:hypothetical protein F751_4654 [Auxenochlorella protothecoides]KFM26161.1 hypothetical protein F751_4654 [Auxenochlorella protothecoides]